MKKVIILFAALFAAVALRAQTPEEIIARMEQETSRFDAEGVSMVMDMKIPLLGTFSTDMYTLGDKYKAILHVKGSTVSTWSDGVTEWTYDPSKNELTIKKADPSDNDSSSVDSLNGITEGYDVQLKKETDEAWYFKCTKSKTNTNKDDPKKMDLVVSKANYLPLSTSITEKGVKVTLRNFTVGVREEDVTFNPDKYSTATIIDKR